MRYTFSILLLAALFIGCKKDKFTTAPQISFKKTKQEIYKRGTANAADYPIFVLNATDAEGDIGKLIGVDTSFVYVRNIKSTQIDSLQFPDLSSIASKKFDFDFEVNTKDFIKVTTSTLKDTLVYEIFIKDFAGNKSNIVKSDPIYYFP